MPGLDMLTGNKKWVESRAGKAIAEVMARSPDEAIKLNVIVDDPELWDRELEFLAHNYEGVISRKIRAKDPDNWDPSCFNNKFLSGGIWPMLMVYYHQKLLDQWLKILQENEG